MSKFKAVIVEDEAKSQELLRSMLETFCPEVEIAGLADSVKKGVALIRSVRPDIVLLDIEMQSATGFDLLQQLEEHDFEVIFTTAFEHYAVKAIKFSALDYLLKPIDVAELKAAVTKAIGRRQKNDSNPGLAELLNNLRPARIPRISISTMDDIIYIEVDQIVRCEAQGAYTIVCLKSSQRITASRNLKEYESLLSDHGFYRVHHSHLVNLREVLRYVKADGGLVEMKDGSRVGVSQNKKEEFLDLMKL
jgi:two-component system LytT family response regulator